MHERTPVEPVRRVSVCFVVESGTDVRLVDGIAEFADLTVFARRIPNGAEINQGPASAVTVVGGPSGIGAFASAVLRFLRETDRRFDFVLVQGYGAAAAAANVAARLSGTPAAMLVCSPAEAYYRCRRGQQGFNKPFKRHELAALQALALVNARIGLRYIVLSQHLRDVVRAHGASVPIEVVPVYGVDTARFRPDPRPRAELRRLRGLPALGAVVFFSSRVAPEKDTISVLDAVARLNQRGRNVFLLHRSGGFRQFAAAAAARGMAAHVIATDAVHPAELPLDYAASDVCVQASHAEGLGFSVLEALACGTPVVATHVGGLRETIVNGATGWSCPPGNVKAMAGAIAEVLDQPDEARRRAFAGRRMVEERFDSRLVFAELQALISRAAAAAHVQRQVP
jgi:D-inositol-3-phosphate glycosyltransferase